MTYPSCLPSALRPARARVWRWPATIAVAAGLVAAAVAPPALAHGVQWSIGIQLPPVGAVVSRAPPVPAYPVYGPPPVVVTPPPVVYVPPRVVYAPPPAVYVPPHVLYAPPPPAWGWGPPPHRHRWKDRDRDGIPDRHDPWDDRRGRGW